VGTTQRQSHPETEGITKRSTGAADDTVVEITVFSRRPGYRRRSSVQHRGVRDVKIQFSLKTLFRWVTGCAMVCAALAILVSSFGWESVTFIGDMFWYGGGLWFLVYGLPAIAVSLAWGGAKLAWRGVASKQSRSERVGFLTASVVMVASGGAGLYWWAFHFMGPIIASGK
jgi:hypothetical protein